MSILLKTISQNDIESILYWFSMDEIYSPTLHQIVKQSEGKTLETLASELHNHTKYSENDQTWQTYLSEYFE